MILDANLLIYAIDTASPHHERARDWLTEQLNGTSRVGLPWQTLTAFLRLTTNPRIFPRPVPPSKAEKLVSDWLALPVAWIPEPTRQTWNIYTTLSKATGGAKAKLVPDAMIAALAITHGVPLASADADFSKFPELNWINPLQD